ncbi:MAG: DUF1488 family protein [Rhizobiales bacterium]|nr:DUF1488 family protein [Hyphomicrobiales bacterium]
MAALLWGKVFHHRRYAGELRQEPGGGCAFTYDPAYIEGRGRPIAHTLPVTATPYRHARGLHPFFDNLVAEGWLRSVQERALGTEDRFALLLAFGRDCVGAVWVEDPDPAIEPRLDLADPESIAAVRSRASLSGVQPKLLVRRDGGSYRPTRAGEPSTHIAKLPSGSLTDIVELEYLTTLATKALLPEDETVEVEVAPVRDITEKALIVRRFDREAGEHTRHFEELAQLLGRQADDKYTGAYADMARFIRNTPACIPAEVERLFRHILARFLLGDTDAHLKNFAMLHLEGGLRLAPSYDLIAASLYKPHFQTLALTVAGAANLDISKLKPKHIWGLAREFGLDEASATSAVTALGRRLDAAMAAIRRSAAAVDAGLLGGRLCERMLRRWNGTFASIGMLLVDEAIRRRKALGLTQRRLGELAGVSTPTVSRLEQAAKDIQLSSALAILEALGMTARRTLIFPEPSERWAGTRDVVRFQAMDGSRRIDCAVSLEALEDHFRWEVDDPLAVLRANRAAIEHRIRLKYLNGRLEPDGSLLLRSEDFG